ncbi:hypothetical protein [Lederbergia citrea]|uniref:hypothetical protein n=1 Tax=Lederbergia citrea TaxID=2833581 RepID=UPI001BC92FB8|nr:hypothetical protein [Lederbergia citrea]MBS4203524.1 hypothetical protein [Lederbergia citrea]
MGTVQQSGAIVISVSVLIQLTGALIKEGLAKLPQLDSIILQYHSFACYTGFLSQPASIMFLQVGGEQFSGRDLGPTGASVWIIRYM